MPTEQRIAEAAALYRAGHKHEAAQIYRDTLLEHPEHADANHNLGMIELEDGHVDASLPFFKAALEAAPNEARYWLSYIGALIQAGLDEDARLVLSYGREAGLSGPDVESLAAALESRSAPPAQSDSPPPSVEEELGNLFAGQRYGEMEKRILDLIQHFPRWLAGWQILSDVYLIQGKDARLSAQQALALNPGDAKEHCYYGLVLKKQGDLKGAASAFVQAITLKPDYAAAYNNLGIVEKDMGDVEAGLSHFRKALQLSPQYADCFSNMLFCLSHSEKVGLTTLIAEHRRFGKQFETQFQALWNKHANDRNPERCLKVGFVSADFREHSLANFFEPVLGYLSLAPGLSLHAYSVSSVEDGVTRRLREKFQHWHDVERLSNEALADKIRADGIDILVDLSGHTSGNRLLTFAMKPAPIQVSWLGYLFTTGMRAMDYYLADSLLLPPGKFDRQFTEKLVQLPANAPFVPFEAAPEVNELPALKNAYLTFACFNRPNKITAAVVALWAKLLRALPESRMLLGGMPNEGSYDTLIEWFIREGITRERLIFHPRSSMENYLKLHHEVDICLDTFPSNGVTTTCHAVWMGVPTLCVNGESLVSRGAMAVMRHVGLQDFVAADQDEFVQKGVSWAGKLDALADVRASLRERFNGSALGRPEQIATALEVAFRTMWKRWCNRAAPCSFEVSQAMCLQAQGKRQVKTDDR